jgi:nucleolar complex protein 2
LVLFSFRCGFGGGSVDLPVSDEDEEEFEDEMDDSEEEGGGGSSKKKAKQHVEQLKRLQQKVRPLSPPVSSPLN